MTSRLNLDWESIELVQAIDWNEVSDFDKEIWDRVNGNFWLPEAIPVSQDIPSWNTFTDEEKLATVQVFAGLTLLDTIQGKVGAISLIPDARTPHEEAILLQIAYMEAVHAKSYSTIFSSLLPKEEIKDIFRWTAEDEHLKKKAAIVLHYYRGDDPLKRKITSTMLESFLFYSGFFMPLWWASKGKLTNSADLIRLIIRDEAIHGYFIGSKFQEAYREESRERQAELKQFADDLLYDLYENEERYSESVYDALGLTEHVKVFLKYNANKAFQNLGFDAPYSKEETRVSPNVLSSLNPESDETHDFFSAKGSAYKLGSTKVEEAQDEDWDF